MKFVRPAALCAALAALPHAALAAPQTASEADLKQLRDQLRELRDSYRQRIDALERRLAEEEARSTSAAVTAAEANRAASVATAAVARVEPAPSRPTSENAFNPAVSLIVDSKFTRLQRDPSTYRIDGFIPSGGEVTVRQKVDVPFVCEVIMFTSYVRKNIQASRQPVQENKSGIPFRG